MKVSFHGAIGFTLALALALLVSSCGERDRPALDTYDQSCSTESDCIEVAVPACVLCGGCPEAAINIVERDRFDDEQQIACPPNFFSPNVNCGPCETTEVVCEESQCTLLFPEREPEE